MNVSYAQEWQFSEPIPVSKNNSNPYYHHLESSGRRNIAISSDLIAIVWEDDRTGTPSIYLALKPITATDFSTEIKLSGVGEAFEPSITALSNKQFAISWEENQQIKVQLVNAIQLNNIKLSSPYTINSKSSMQSNLVHKNNSLYIVYSEQADIFSQIKLTLLNFKQLQLSQIVSCPVDSDTITADQFYPTAQITDDQLIVAWEDRRFGHTVIMASSSDIENLCQFHNTQRVSQNPVGPKRPYGKGHGVARVALSRFGQSDIMAIWADKRNFMEGYDIYTSQQSKKGNWSLNTPAQDDFGGIARQWHASISGHTDGRLVAAWTDEREGNSDIYFSSFEQNDWSEDIALQGASGPKEQSHPSIILDSNGDLHVAWIVRQKTGAPTELFYTMGHMINND